MRRRDQENVEPASNDPAAVIAQALRRKFANRMFQDSPGVCVCVCVRERERERERDSSLFYTDRENLDRSSDTSASGFDSPSGKLVSFGIYPVFQI